MILGPLTQYYAFGALWTGFPFGIDLTDNKTLIALIGWIIAAFMLKRFEKAGMVGYWSFNFVIPHLSDPA